MSDEEIINVAGHLGRLAAEQPDVLVVAVPEGKGFRRVSAGELDRLANRSARGLATLGVQRGTRTVLMVKPSVDFFALTFALLKLGAVPVFVDPGMGLRKLGQCLAEARPRAFIGITAAHVARLIFFRRALPEVDIWVTVGRKLGWQGAVYETLMADAGDSADAPYEMGQFGPDEVSAILFTSGSTGTPKGAVYTHGIWSAQVRLLKQTYGIEPGERDLSTFPLFALFGPALGMAAIVPPMDASRPGRADPAALLDAARKFECTSMFVNPALVDKLGRHAQSKKIGPIKTLVRVISAGAPANPAALERFSALLPEGVEVFTPYGATEALPVANVGSKTILEHTRSETERGKGVCVGKPVEGVEVAIIRITDDAIEDWSDAEILESGTGEIGEIVVCAPIISPRYFGRDEADEATKLAKIPGESGRLRHRMGDTGYLDGEGRLWMCGRKSHRVVTADATMFTVPCEAVFNVHPKVFRSALVGVERHGRVVPVLCVEFERGAVPDLVLMQLRRIAREHQHTRAIEHFLDHPRFPVDVRHNAKIFREQLAQWADEMLP